MTEESLGMFDASAAPLFDLWGFGFRTGTEVTQAMIDSVLQFVGMDHFHVDSLKAGTGLTAYSSKGTIRVADLTSTRLHRVILQTL